MVVDRPGSRHRQADLGAHCRRFRIEVVEHLDVIADEPRRNDHRSLQRAGILLLAQEITDVGTEPGIFGAAAAALIHRDVGERETGAGTHRVSDEPRRSQVLRFVRIPRGHALGNAVSREDECRATPYRVRQ